MVYNSFMGVEDVTQRKKAIMGFLYANDAEPVDKIHLMKEVFWLSGQSATFSELIENYGPYDYGPDDQELEADVEELVSFGYVDILNEKEKQYAISTEGKKIIKDLFGEKELLVFETIKQTLNRLTFEELLFLVYKRFPEFAVNSVAKNVLKKERQIIPRLISKGAISQAYAAKILGISIQEVQHLCKCRC